MTWFKTYETLGPSFLLAHKKELATSNALLYKKSQELQAIMNHSQKIRSMRSAIQTMHRKFLKEDPCSSIALTDNSSWIDLVL